MLQQPAAFMTPELRDQLRQRVLVIVRGYLSSLYRACLGAYLDHQVSALTVISCCGSHKESGA